MYSVPGYVENAEPSGVAPNGLASVVLPVKPHDVFVAAEKAAKLIWLIIPALVATRMRSFDPAVVPAVPATVFNVTAPSSVQPPPDSMKPRFMPLVPKYNRVKLLVPMYSVPGYVENAEPSGVAPNGLASVGLPVKPHDVFVAAAKAAKLIWLTTPALVAKRMRSFDPIDDPAVPATLFNVTAPSRLQPPVDSMKPRFVPFVPKYSRVALLVPMYSVPA
jgi:hypothetical protein